MATLERAISIAAAAHEGQVDKAGRPYILHPLRLMLSMSTEDEMLAAVLHDVVEDSAWDVEGLRNEGFPAAVINAVQLLTHDDETPYEEYVRRTAEHPIARKVKIADLKDNMDQTRIADPTEKDRARIERYRRALKLLEPDVP